MLANAVGIAGQACCKVSGRVEGICERERER